MELSLNKRRRVLKQTDSGHFKVELEDKKQVEHIGTHTECIRIIKGISIQSLQNQTVALH